MASRSFHIWHPVLQRVACADISEEPTLSSVTKLHSTLVLWEGSTFTSHLPTDLQFKENGWIFLKHVPWSSPSTCPSRHLLRLMARHWRCMTENSLGLTQPSSLPCLEKALVRDLGGQRLRQLSGQQNYKFYDHKLKTWGRSHPALRAMRGGCTREVMCWTPRVASTEPCWMIPSSGQWCLTARHTCKQTRACNYHSRQTAPEPLGWAAHALVSSWALLPRPTHTGSVHQDQRSRCPLTWAETTKDLCTRNPREFGSHQVHNQLSSAQNLRGGQLLQASRTVAFPWQRAHEWECWSQGGCDFPWKEQVEHVPAGHWQSELVHFQCPLCFPRKVLLQPAPKWPLVELGLLPRPEFRETDGENDARQEGDRRGGAQRRQRQQYRQTEGWGFGKRHVNLYRTVSKSVRNSQRAYAATEPGHRVVSMQHSLLTASEHNEVCGAALNF